MPLLKRKIEDCEDEENEPNQEHKDNDSTDEHINKKIKKDTNQELIINDNMCTICLDNIKENNYVKTCCNHIFCLSCLLEHLKVNQTCPCCRSSIEPIRKNGSKHLSINDVSSLTRLNIEQNHPFLSQITQEIIPLMEIISPLSRPSSLITLGLFWQPPCTHHLAKPRLPVT